MKSLILELHFFGFMNYALGFSEVRVNKQPMVVLPTTVSAKLLFKRHKELQSNMDDPKAGVGQANYTSNNMLLYATPKLRTGCLSCTMKVGNCL